MAAALERASTQTAASERLRSSWITAFFQPRIDVKDIVQVSAVGAAEVEDVGVEDRPMPLVEIDPVLD